MEVDKVYDKVADMVADKEVDKVTDKEVNKVADMVAGHGCWLIGPKLFYPKLTRLASSFYQRLYVYSMNCQNTPF